MMEFRSFIVEEKEATQRLDRLIHERYPDLSRTRIQALILQEKIIMDGELTTPARKVKVGMEIHIYIPEPLEAYPQPQAIPLDIYYEDQDLLVINKPAGMVVHPAPGSYDHTLVNALLAYCGSSLSGIGGVRRPGIVHRLDKGTSGLLIVAKNDSAHQSLSEQLVSRTLTRTYQTLVWGSFSPSQGIISGNIGRSAHNRQKMALLTRGGKEAITHYRTLQVFGNFASLMECQLKTGRTHQIRVHLTSRGHGIISDPVYGNPPSHIPLSLRSALKEITHPMRPLLHSWQIEFIHPRYQKKYSFTAKIPSDFIKTIDLFNSIF